jgi:tetratricopeptide (TPR) repeat protein
MKKLLISVLTCLLFTASFCQQKVYVFDSTCRIAYKEIISLKLNHGQELINKARIENPANLIPDLLEGYIDFFTLFFNEDPAEYEIRKVSFEQRLNSFDSGPHNTPFYRYSKALTYLQRAAVKIKFGERYSAGWDFKKANSQIKENKSAYAHFQPNNMIYGPLQVVIGTVPQGYKWVTSIFGLKGSINEGMQRMRSFINSNDTLAKLFANEATFYYCYLVFYIENNPNKAFELIRTRKLDIVNNHLFAYLAANLAINSKQTDYARQIILGRNMLPDYMQTPAWDFELGYVKFHKLKLDDAIVSYKKFIDSFKGQFYVKDVLQKISWAYYLKGNKEEAEKYRLLTIRNGNTDSDADKKAYKDAKQGLWPDETLLKARILNDGGYPKEALTMISKKNIDDYTKPEEKLELAYRMARIYDDMGKENEAIQFYETAIKLGKDRPEYYAARAALQMGFIYERRNKKKLAIASFQECLNMGDHEYKDSLDQKAKAGIARCKGE